MEGQCDSFYIIAPAVVIVQAYLRAYHLYELNIRLTLPNYTNALSFELIVKVFTSHWSSLGFGVICSKTRQDLD